MGTYRVTPNGNKWTVEKNGRTLSSHRKKRRARNAAKQKANSGDMVVIHRSNGTIMDRRTVR